MKTILHVNQHVIKKNIKHKTNDPPLTVKTYKSNDYCQEAIICDKDGNEVARVVHRPHKPLSCGARVWIESENEVICIDGVKIK
jgi:hypothetical protein